jgi:hypothetical protein
VAVLGLRSRPAGNWIAAALPFFADPAVAAVVAPTVAPLGATLRESAAAGILESRLGGGSRRSRHFPGNVRIVSDYPAENVVVRRPDYAAALEAEVDDEQLVAWLAERGRKTVYAPDTSVSEVPPPLFVPHLRGTWRHAKARGASAHRSGGGSLSGGTLLSLLPAALAFGGVILIATGAHSVRKIGIGLLAGYIVLVAVSALLAGARFRSTLTGLLAVPALIATQAVYVAGFLRGLVRRR